MIVGWTWNIYYDGYPWTWLDDDQIAIRIWPTKEEALADANEAWSDSEAIQLIAVTRG